MDTEGGGSVPDALLSHTPTLPPSHTHTHKVAIYSLAENHNEEIRKHVRTLGSQITVVELDRYIPRGLLRVNLQIRRTLRECGALVVHHGDGLVAVRLVARRVGRGVLHHMGAGPTVVVPELVDVQGELRESF